MDSKEEITFPQWAYFSFPLKKCPPPQAGNSLSTGKDMVWGRQLLAGNQNQPWAGSAIKWAMQSEIYMAPFFGFSIACLHLKLSSLWLQPGPPSPSSVSGEIYYSYRLCSRRSLQMSLARGTFILFHFVETCGSAWTFVLPSRLTSWVQVRQVEKLV